MKKKPRYVRFFVGLFLTLFILGSIVLGGYFILDKWVVPRYFSQYGINNLRKLVGMMQTLYNVPSESEMVKHGYSDADLTRATKNLREKGYPILEDGTFDFEGFDSGVRGTGDLSLTDSELCAVLDKLLRSTEFSQILPNLNYIDTLNMNLKELTITPKILEDGTSSKNSARIGFVIKIDTAEVRNQMSKEMDIPIFLLNMIFPKQMYLSGSYDVLLDNTSNPSKWTTSNGKLLINGSSDEQSTLVLELLISFIYNDEEHMTKDKLIDNFGHILDQGVELLGEIEFASGLGTVSKNQNGIYFLPTDVQLPQNPEQEETQNLEQYSTLNTSILKIA